MFHPTHSNPIALDPGGVALEYIISLCNELDAAPWINVPHLADDDYVTKLATMLRDKLRPDVKVYVEHSNEAWNAAFPQVSRLRIDNRCKKTIGAYPLLNRFFPQGGRQRLYQANKRRCC